MKQVQALALGLSLLTLPSQATFAPFALERSQTRETYQNQATYLNTQEANSALTTLTNHLQYQYPNHSFQVKHSLFSNDSLEKQEDGSWTYQVDVTLSATATLSTTTEKHPLLTGMKQVLQSLSPDEAELVSSAVSAYEETLSQSYLQPQDITACYRLVYDCTSHPDTSPLPSPSYYSGHRYTNDQSLLPSYYLRATEKYTDQVRQGQEAVLALLANLKTTTNPRSTLVYDSKLAVAYAKNHATAQPEYNAENRMGNDCANFVSFALMAGGIPADKEGDWYPSPATGEYGGLNWIRTGFVQGAGGVVPYLTQQNLFLPLENKTLLPQGSILSYQEDSHVSLVTYHDGELMLHAYRSNETVEFNNYLHEGDYADYYSPHPHLQGGSL